MQDSDSSTPEWESRPYFLSLPAGAPLIWPFVWRSAPNREQVFRLVLAQGLWLALVGISIGLVVSVLLTGFLKFFLCGVSATDVLTFAAVGVLLLSCSAPCFVPARRATRVTPWSPFTTKPGFADDRRLWPRLTPFRPSRKSD